ncbi:hypothetical protein [Streptomyces sp. NPDC047525]|uniref:hypothetical protein n=1 Tax=Streptomyces sp. NPDC047525 TaxID=3155264 RepID=UPI0033F41FBC
MMLTLVVGLMLGGAVAYAAYKDQKLGAALAIGAAVVGLFYIVIEKDPSAASPQQTVPPFAPASTSTPTQTPPGQPTPP